MHILVDAGIEVKLCLPFEIDKSYDLPKDLRFSRLDREIGTADMLVCFGGDGTILHMAKTATRNGIPILGVNIGTMGFMAELESTELQELARLATDDYTVEERMMLDVSVFRDRDIIFHDICLNDVVITKGSVARIVHMAVKCDGVQALELRSVWNKGIFELTEEDVCRLERELKAEGMQVSAIATPFYKCAAFDESAIATHQAGLRRAAEMAKRLGTNILRGFCFFREEAVTEDYIAHRLLEIEPLLAETGCILALESDPTVNACNGAELAAVIKKVNSPHIRAVWDPGNDLFAPVAEEPYPQGYAVIRPYIAHVHLKDAVRTKEGAQAVRFFTGEAALKECLQALADSGYAGYVSVETHYRTRKMTEEELRLPGGAAFTDGAYEATRECLESLKEEYGRIFAARKEDT